jgi:hypothetical protein
MGEPIILSKHHVQLTFTSMDSLPKKRYIFIRNCTPMAVSWNCTPSRYGGCHGCVVKLYSLLIWAAVMAVSWNCTRYWYGGCHGCVVKLYSLLIGGGDVMDVSLNCTPYWYGSCHGRVVKLYSLLIWGSAWMCRENVLLTDMGLSWMCPEIVLLTGYDHLRHSMQ